MSEKTSTYSPARSCPRSRAANTETKKEASRASWTPSRAPGGGDVAGETEPGKKSGPDADDDDDDDESTSDGYDETYFGGFGDDAFESVWLSLDHADGEAHAFLRDAGEAAAAAAAADASADVRKKTLGDLLAAVALHVAMASEAGEFTMRDVVLEAARDVRKRTISRDDSGVRE
jgi:hypothetical protein